MARKAVDASDVAGLSASFVAAAGSSDALAREPLAATRGGEARKTGDIAPLLRPQHAAKADDSLWYTKPYTQFRAPLRAYLGKHRDLFLRLVGEGVLIKALYERFKEAAPDWPGEVSERAFRKALSSVLRSEGGTVAPVPRRRASSRYTPPPAPPAHLPSPSAPVPSEPEAGSSADGVSSAFKAWEKQMYKAK